MPEYTFSPVGNHNQHAMVYRVARSLSLIVLALAMPVLSGGCCSIFLGRTQPVTVITDPAGAKFQVDGRDYQTPTPVELQRNGHYIINFSKAGYQDKTFEMNRQLHPLVWLSFLYYLVPGFVDLGTGAAYKQTPDAVFVYLEPLKDGTFSSSIDGKPTAVIRPPASMVVPIRIAVWQLTASTGINTKVIEPLTESLRDSLLKSGRFQIMARGEMEKVLKEQQISLAAACDTTDCAVEYGQNLSVAKIVVGNVAKVGTTYQVMLKIVDVATTTEEKTGKARAGGGEEALFVLVDKAAAELLVLPP